MPGASKRSLSVGLPAIFLLVALAVFLWESWEVHPQIDDAYISYRYADNLVKGNGLVFNPGERVEGYTNLLWTLLIAVGIRAGLEAPQIAHALGVASGLAALLATFFYARGGLPSSQQWLAGLAPGIVASSGSFALWATRGLETPLFVALVILALAAQQAGRTVWATIAVVVATLTRPEGAILAAVVLSFEWWQSSRRGVQRWTPVFSYGLALAGLTGFRLAYYGSPLPNTFYAKVGDVPISGGVEEVLAFLAESSVPLLLLAGFCVLQDRRTWPGAAFVLVLAIYVVAIGGDGIGPGRFLLPALSCLAALSVRGVFVALREDRFLGALIASTIAYVIWWHYVGTVSGVAVHTGVTLALGALLTIVCYRCSSRPKRWAVVAFWLGLTGLAVVLLTYRPSRLGPLRPGGAMDVSRSARLEKVRNRAGFFDAYSKRRVKQILSLEPPVGLVASIAIGRFGYNSGLPILDLVGLADRTVAKARAGTTEGRLLPGHQRSDADYVFDRKPDLILIPQASPRRAPLPAMLDIWSHPDLETYYQWDPSFSGYRRLRP